MVVALILVSHIIPDEQQNIICRGLTIGEGKKTVEHECGYSLEFLTSSAF